MAEAIPWWKVGDQEVALLLPDSVSADLTAVADSMGVGMCDAELQSILADICWKLSPGLGETSDEALTAAVRALIPLELRRLALGHAVVDDC